MINVFFTLALITVSTSETSASTNWAFFADGDCYSNMYDLRFYSDLACETQLPRNNFIADCGINDASQCSEAFIDDIHKQIQLQSKVDNPLWFGFSLDDCSDCVKCVKTKGQGSRTCPAYSLRKQSSDGSWTVVQQWNQGFSWNCDKFSVDGSYASSSPCEPSDFADVAPPNVDCVVRQAGPGDCTASCGEVTVSEVTTRQSGNGAACVDTTYSCKPGDGQCPPVAFSGPTQGWCVGPNDARLPRAEKSNGHRIPKNEIEAVCASIDLCTGYSIWNEISAGWLHVPVGTTLPSEYKISNEGSVSAYDIEKGGNLGNVNSRRANCWVRDPKLVAPDTSVLLTPISAEMAGIGEVLDASNCIDYTATDASSQYCHATGAGRNAKQWFDFTIPSSTVARIEIDQWNHGSQGVHDRIIGTEIYAGDVLCGVATNAMAQTFWCQANTDTTRVRVIKDYSMTANGCCLHLQEIRIYNSEGGMITPTSAAQHPSENVADKPVSNCIAGASSDYCHATGMGSGELWIQVNLEPYSSVDYITVSQWNHGSQVVHDRITGSYVYADDTLCGTMTNEMEQRFNCPSGTTASSVSIVKDYAGESSHCCLHAHSIKVYGARPRTSNPTMTPSYHPSFAPTSNPTMTPSYHPSFTPTSNPTMTPSYHPSFTPTSNPTLTPSAHPTMTPTVSPSPMPSAQEFMMKIKGFHGNPVSALADIVFAQDRTEVKNIVQAVKSIKEATNSQNKD